jgi:hypothetical protein
MISSLFFLGITINTFAARIDAPASFTEGEEQRLTIVDAPSSEVLDITSRHDGTTHHQITRTADGNGEVTLTLPKGSYIASIADENNKPICTKALLVKGKRP